eukprot:286803_1
MFSTGNDLIKQSETLKIEGNDLMRQGKFEDAIAKYTGSIQLNPKNEKLYSNRALAYHKLNKLDLALNDVNNGIEINPKWYKLYTRKGAIYKSMDRNGEAIKLYEIALKLTDNQQIKNDIENIIEKLPKPCNYLSKEEIFKFMTNSIMIKSQDGMTAQGRPDFIKRLNLFDQMVKNKKLQNFECKDLFGFENANQLLKLMNKAREMGCHGNNVVEFEKFNQGLSCPKYETNNQIQTRFNEWIQAGMCHHCQIKIFELDGGSVKCIS